MSFNLQGAAQVPLSVFGGMVTEMAPPDLPEGTSPDCQDVVFAPGSVASRPALQQVFTVPFPKGSAVYPATILYGKTFNSPGGGIDNLYLDSNGNLWFEDVVNSPGTYTLLGTTSPGTGIALYAKSVTAFGREYLALSDGLHGQDVALQWDGTNLDRVTQDGPGVAPAVSCFSLPSVALAVISGSGAAISTITTTDLVGSYYTTLTIVFTAPVSLPLGTAITVSGNSNGLFNGYLSGITEILSPTTVKLGGWYSATLQTGNGGATAATGAATLVSSGKVVTVGTAAAHNLQVGYQAQLAGIAPAVFGATGWQSGASISSIVINNENQPGVATVTTSVAHGLPPGVQVAITGVAPVAVGGAITAISWAGSVALASTTTAHGLSPGAVVTIAGVGVVAYNGTWVVLQVLSATSFTFSMVVLTAPAASSAGTVTVSWPIPNTPEPTLFEVLSAPTATTFQIQVTYTDGTWTSGTLSFLWDGTYFVSAIVSSIVFQFNLAAPPMSIVASGTATPYGQCTPGIHQCSVSFLTRNGYLTRPSPSVQFTSPGGQYLSISSLPIGPPDVVVARILNFTGAGGSFFFYIPTIPLANGIAVGTATQINDNTSTSCVLDFSDNTLYASLGISKDGNDTAAQLLLDSALGFGFFGSRLIAYGQRNRIQNFLNMGFEGGYIVANQPAGWTVGGAGGTLVAAHYGIVFQTAGSSATLTQSAYRDGYGVPILTANTKYRFRCWASSGGLANITATLSSSAGGWSITATGTITAGFPGFVDVAFSAATPAAINSDAVLSISADTSPVQLDDISIVYAANPYLTDVAWMSYVNNPEAFDGVTGIIGPSDDTHQIMETVGMGGALYLLTLDPGGRIHKILNNGTTEPAFWPIAQIGANCGVLSAFATTKSQADDSTASGGEEWFAWASATGARIYEGSQPWKISQEIDPDWRGAAAAGAVWSSAPGILPAYQLTTWALNDPAARRIYFGLPLAGNPQGAPNKVYVMDYRELDTAYQIAQAAPIHTSYTGRLIATDHTRKWTRWNMTMNGAALMCRTPGALSLVFLGGNGSVLRTLPGTANVYTLNAAAYTDDDFGQISPYYTTYFFVTHDQEQSLKLGGGRKMVSYFTAFVAGLGTLTITPLVDALTNAWAQIGNRALSSVPTYDLEWTGGCASGQRIAFRLSTTPPPAGVVATSGPIVTWTSGSNFAGLRAGSAITISAAEYTILTWDSPTQVTLTASAGVQVNATWSTTDNWCSLVKIMVAMKQATHLPIRGAA